MKDYIYISQQKIDNIEAQLRHQRVNLLKVVPKIDLFGFLSISAETEINHKDNIINQVDKLINNLRKQKKVKELSKINKLETEFICMDCSEWFNGLFYVDGGENAIVFYLLWRVWQDSIILLTGSPKNILGEKAISAGVDYYGTSGSLWKLAEIMQRTFRLSNLNDISATDIGEVSEKMPISVANKVQNHLGYKEPYKAKTVLSAVDVGKFCVQYLSELPKVVTDTAFRVHLKLEFDSRIDLPIWFIAMNKLDIPDSLRKKVEKCRRVYIGSPIYTANTW